MRKGRLTLPILATTIAATFISSYSTAGVYTDDLSKCLVASTTVTDRNNMVRWMFAAAAKHPAVSEIVTVTPEVMEQTNKTMGDLMNRLLLVSCKTETMEAIKYEGGTTIEASFQVLGQVAGRELFSNPAVAESLSNLDKHIDSAALEKLLN